MTPESLKAWRRQNALSQTAAATLAGYCRAAWNSWERGVTPAPLLAAWMITAHDAGLPAPIAPPDRAALKAWRKTNGLTQTAAGGLAGVTCVTWSNWERGRTPIPLLAAWMITAYDAGIDLDGTGGPARPG